MLPFLRADLAQLNAYTPHPEAAVDGPTLIDQLDTNECPYDLPEDLKQKLAWTYQNQIAANRYPDGAHADLKLAISAYVAEASPQPVTITPDQISVGNGSDELIRSILIATCLGNQGSILVANPTFSMYGILAQTLGIPVVTATRTETFELNLAEARSALESTEPNRPPIRVVFMVHPNSPTGNALTEAEIDWLKQLPSHVLAVIDEAYFEFSQQTLVSELANHPNWMILRTFSKAFRLAAHRVGYAIGHLEIIAALEKVRLPYNLPAVSQAAALLALVHRQALLQSVSEIQDQRAELYQAVQSMKGLKVWPSAANFIFGSTGSDSQNVALAQSLKQLGTSIRTTGGGLRMTVGSPAENSRTLQHLQHTLKSL
jgi:histidinol-phosphate aminotransferase